MMTYAQARQFVDSFSHSGSAVQTLDRTAALLAAVGDPQKQLRFVHIAGTNGKGSVTEYLARTLTDCGYRTGSLTSPFIRHYRDRIRLNLEDIPKDAFCEACTVVADAVGSFPYSQFEITMAIALVYFAREGAEIIVLETGIGGTLDATNIIEHPLACVVTAVSMDHMAILGSSIEEIAAQKAGILKSGSEAVFSYDSKPAALQVLTETAQQKQVPYHIPDRDACTVLSADVTGSTFTYHGSEYRLSMGGMHQIANAMTALETLDILRRNGFVLPTQTVQQALVKVQVPARIQVLQQDPLVILDGGHNADGVGALVRSLSESGIENWIGICGMMHNKDKDAAAFQLALVLSRVLCVDGFAEGALPAQDLAAAFTRQHALAQPMALEDALPYAIRWAKGSGGAVVICGSLYLASRFLT